MITRVEINGSFETLDLQRVSRSNPLKKGDLVLTRDHVKGRFCKATVVTMNTNKVFLSIDPWAIKAHSWGVAKSEVSNQMYIINKS